MLSSKENYNIANNCAVLEQMFIVLWSLWKAFDLLLTSSGGFVLQALLVIYFSSKIKSETSSLSKAIEAKFF